MDTNNAYIHACLARLAFEAAQERYLAAPPGKELTRLVGEYRKAQQVYREAAITFFESYLEAEVE